MVWTHYQAWRPIFNVIRTNWQSIFHAPPALKSQNVFRLTCCPIPCVFTRNRCVTAVNPAWVGHSFPPKGQCCLRWWPLNIPKLPRNRRVSGRVPDHLGCEVAVAETRGCLRPTIALVLLGFLGTLWNLVPKYSIHKYRSPRGYIMVCASNHRMTWMPFVRTRFLFSHTSRIGITHKKPSNSPQPLPNPSFDHSTISSNCPHSTPT